VDDLKCAIEWSIKPHNSSHLDNPSPREHWFIGEYWGRALVGTSLCTVEDANVPGRGRPMLSRVVGAKLGLALGTINGAIEIGKALSNIDGTLLGADHGVGKRGERREPDRNLE
jgi:hypothetical protein